MRKSILKIFFLLLWLSSLAVSHSEELSVTFIDVGQGDSIFIRTPNGRTLLIDGGGTPSWKESDYDPGAAVVVPFLKKNGVSKLDCVVATHADGDHIGGLPAVLRAIPVGIVYENGFEGDSPEYRNLHLAINSKRIASSVLRQGMTLNLDPSVTFYVLSPPKDYYFEDSNNNAIVIRMVYGEVSFLFTGDIEFEGEYSLIKKYGDGLQSMILKVGHHGSATSTSDEFLAWVSPEVAVIQVGKYNGFGHPYPGTLAKFDDAGIEVLRTDKSGSIRIDTDGKTFGITTARPPVKEQDDKKNPGK